MVWLDSSQLYFPFYWRWHPLQVGKISFSKQLQVKLTHMQDTTFQWAHVCEWICIQLSTAMLEPCVNQHSHIVKLSHVTMCNGKRAICAWENRGCARVTSCQATYVAHCTQLRRTSEQWQRRREPGRWDPPPRHSTARSVLGRSPTWRREQINQLARKVATWELLSNTNTNNSPCADCDSRPEQSAGEDQPQWNSAQTASAQVSPAEIAKVSHVRLKTK